jgi:hypothetical protein
MPVGRKRGRQVRGDGRLAHPTFSGGDADDVLHLRKRAGRKPCAPKLCLEALLLVVGENVEADIHSRHALELGHALGNGLLEVVADGAARGRQRDDYVHDSAIREVDRAHHLELDDRTP